MTAIGTWEPTTPQSVAILDEHCLTHVGEGYVF